MKKPNKKRSPQTELPPARDAADVETFRESFRWQKIQLPKTWHPRQVGDEIMGYYGGRTLRIGKFGQYEVALIHTLTGPVVISGTELIQLLDSANIDKGHAVRICWQGVDELPGGRTKKRFELLVAQGETLREDELPQVRVA